MQHNLRTHEHGLFLQCMADNTHADRKTFRGVIKLLQRIHDGVQEDDAIHKVLLECFGIPTPLHAHWSWSDPERGKKAIKEEEIKTLKKMLLLLINQLDNIMELQDENQPAIQKIATFLDNLTHKENEK